MLRRGPLSLITLLIMAGCGDGNLQLEGKIQSVHVMGHRCWYIETSDLKYYEIYSEDTHLLQEGRKVRLQARKSDKTTVCQVGILLDVISYKVID